MPLLQLKLASSSKLPKLERSENGRMIQSDVLSDKEIKLREAYNNVGVVSRYTYKIKMTDEIEPTVMYPIVFSIDAEAAPNLINAAFRKSQ